MVNVFKPTGIPPETNRLKIFLAGSIEMGKAVDWQTEIANILEYHDIDLYNPRRDDWDSSWEQDPTIGTKFEEQVSWEQDRIHESDVCVFFFDGDTKSPITLLELGVALASGIPCLIMCPENFWRYGNVCVTARRYENAGLWNNKVKFFEALKNVVDAFAEPVAETKIQVLDSVNESLKHYLISKYGKDIVL